MKQRACDLDRMEWRREKLLRRKLASIPISPSVRLERFGFGQLRREGVQRDVDGIRKGLYALTRDDRTGSLGIAEILELSRHRRNARVENTPHYAVRLAKDFGRLF